MTEQSLPGSSPERAIVLRYHEIALKGDNRGWFEECLAANARRMIERQLRLGRPDLEKIRIQTQRQHGRILIDTPWNERVRDALERVFGISSISPIRKVPTERNALIKAALEEFQGYISAHGFPKSFRVLTRRSDKALPEKSGEIDYFIGGEIKERYPDLLVDLEDPEMTVGVEIRFEKSFLWTEKYQGPGGLPVGSNAPVLALISGGLDSPVAAIQTMRRGSAVSFLHFHGAPFIGDDVLEKVKDLVRITNRFQPEPQSLHVVPFGKIQERIALASSARMRTVLYRRMMIRIGCELAKTSGLHAVITGESLGQVASQTVENLSTINSVATIPILRPLITYDKDEIIAAARRFGSFETSIRKGIDCCTLFADRHPALRTTIPIVEEHERKFNVAEMVSEALSNVQVHRT
ncbi:MAG: tRNA 4-thiouridine(8) synthase ThiI [Bdellovibrionales bacterium RIFOXYD1_FULL_55_31]|nr:MAG: tRNA 4-thiouridine(8) synthase ThiI [Bdellovibrionales bacterium RIFOXYD1_FULL_55_31]